MTVENKTFGILNMSEDKKISEMTTEELSDYANEGLLTKNRELLAEVKKFKSASSDLQVKYDAAQAEIKDLRLTQPVNEMISRLFKSGISASLGSQIISEYADFRLEADGTIGIYDKDGKRTMDVRTSGDNKTPLEFEWGAMVHWLDEVSGSAYRDMMEGMPVGTDAGGHVSHRGYSSPEKSNVSPHAARLGLK